LDQVVAARRLFCDCPGFYLCTGAHKSGRIKSVLLAGQSPKAGGGEALAGVSERERETQAFLRPGSIYVRLTFAFRAAAIFNT
jgi:hypothetical protein